jgi:FAD/FMN-containing dehydrogenase
LFFGIRGGGSNFGIITTFQLALHPMPKICWSGNLFFKLDKLEALVEAAREWKENIMTADESTLMGMTQSRMDGSQVCTCVRVQIDLANLQVIMIMAWHRGTAVTGKDKYKVFDDIGKSYLRSSSIFILAR